MNWANQNQKLIKNFKFKTFTQALDFINQIGQLAEQANHHPDISIHDYNQVTIELTTHDQGAITEKDEQLANKIDLMHENN